MADQPAAGPDRGGPDIVELVSVPGFLAFDMPGAPLSAGGTRMATDVTAGKVALMARFCAEVAPLINAGRFVTGPDMGTSEEDFAPLRDGRGAPGAMGAVLGGVPFEDMLTGYGVAAAADAALGAEWGWGWDGRSVAIEGFGKVGGGVAREVT